MTGEIEKYKEEIKNLDAGEIIAWAMDTFGQSRLVLASSLSAEDQLLTHLLLSSNNQSRIFTLDTGRLFQETYDTMQKTMDRYNFSYEIYAPENTAIESLVSVHGPNLFYKSVELRKKCCSARKTIPLQRVLKTADAWICGLRRDQAVTRDYIEPIEFDHENKLFKINPLYNWTEQMVWESVKNLSIPYNPLQDNGFRSIGCAPCTRAIDRNDDIRSGRWWWEDPEHKECGLHAKPKT